MISGIAHKKVLHTGIDLSIEVRELQNHFVQNRFLYFLPRKPIECDTGLKLFSCENILEGMRGSVVLRVILKIK